MLDDELMPYRSDSPAPYQPPIRSSLDYRSVSLPVQRSDAAVVPTPDTPAAAAITLFGNALPPGTTPQQAQQAAEGIIKTFTAAMQGTPGWDIAVNWFRNQALAPVSRERAQHNYDVAGFRFPQVDQPHVDSFLNHMARQQVPQAAVHAMLKWYVDLGKPKQQQQQPVQVNDAALEARDERDKQAGLNELRVRWGQEFPLRMRVVGQHFGNLPAHIREHIDTAVLADGTLAANNPDFIEQLYHEAIGTLPSKGSLAAEIASLEARMRTNRKAWNKDEAAQARLRALYDQRDGR